MEPKWHTELYQSGSTVVSRRDGGVYFYVWHVPGDTEGQCERHRTAKAIETFMNEGKIDDMLTSSLRIDGDSVGLKSGCVIRATGPMIDTAKPPSWGCWMEDPSDDAKIARGLLADALHNLKPLFTTL